jgi:nucleotide-binding universal stress UspA family protein
MPRNILVPVDGSAFSECALPAAETLARRSQATLHIVRIHVPATQAPLSLEGMPVTDPDRDARRWDTEQAYLMRIRRQLGSRAEVATRIAVLNGPVAEVLATYASLNRVDLIVMSTHGRRGLTRAWAGSVSDALMRGSRIPVLLVRPPEGGTTLPAIEVPPRILIALDGSRLAEEVVEPAVKLARALDARLTLLRVVNPLGPGDGLAVVFAPGAAKTLAAQHEAEAASYLTEIAWWLRDRGLDVETMVVPSERPAQVIVAEATRQGCALVAMATHGRSGLSRLLLGSVAGSVLHETRVPLLLYRPKADRHRHRTQPAAIAAAT